MIQVSNDGGLHMEGSMKELLVECTGVLSGMYEIMVIKNKMPKEMANSLLTQILFTAVSVGENDPQDIEEVDDRKEE